MVSFSKRKVNSSWKCCRKLAKISQKLWSILAKIKKMNTWSKSEIGMILCSESVQTNLCVKFLINIGTQVTLWSKIRENYIIRHILQVSLHNRLQKVCTKMEKHGKFSVESGRVLTTGQIGWKFPNALGIKPTNQRPCMWTSQKKLCVTNLPKKEIIHFWNQSDGTFQMGFCVTSTHKNCQK